MRQAIQHEIDLIRPFDPVEREHIEDALNWINSDAQIFRVRKPASPPKHLVAYCVVVSDTHILLAAHINAGLWLPTGGHAEVNEHPRVTAVREAWDELQLHAEFVFDAPEFLSVTETVGRGAGHTDVSLWYVLRAETGTEFEYDREEFHTVRWFHKDELPPAERIDPTLARFVHKYFES